MSDISAELAALAAHLGPRRDTVLARWREAIGRDPALGTGDALPTEQLNDHVPALLAAFERDLQHAADASATGVAPADPAAGDGDAAAHGLHRWQQGYDLRQVTRELGVLNACMVEALDCYAETIPVPPAAMAVARRLWATAHGRAIEDSTAQFYRLHEAEAAGYVGDLERALEDIREIDRHRGALWEQVAHDLRGNVGVMASATRGLTGADVSDDRRARFLQALDRNVGSLRHLLDDVTALARLTAGRETRQVADTDVGALLHDLCEGLQPMAQERGLVLRYDGPAPLQVAADPVKTRRLAQNLVLNAIRYTQQGSVTVAWGDSDPGDDRRWALTVQDTGPGLHAAAPLGGAIAGATQLAHTAGRDVATPAASLPPADVPPIAAVAPPVPPALPPGEGIGLSIVKRLCELLDATIELQTAPGRGTRFRILLPRIYAAEPPRP